jgi:hypothetical protein
MAAIPFFVVASHALKTSFKQDYAEVDFDPLFTCCSYR